MGLLIDFVRRHERILSFVYRRLNRTWAYAGLDNSLSLSGVFAKRTSFVIKGRNNTICINKGLTRLNNCSFTIIGNNNTIIIGAGCKLKDVSFYIEDSDGTITVGENTIITGKTHFAVIEGTSIRIGKRCLFSQNVTFRTGDSHSIIDKNGGRINPSKDIEIGDHVWIGNSVTVLKGTKVQDESVIATGRILTGKEFPTNCVIGGIGGNILKKDIGWCEERLPIV